MSPRPLKSIKNITINVQMDITKIFLNIPGVIIEALRQTGCISRISCDGPSVANASEPRLSMSKLTYSSYIDVRGDSVKTAAPKNAIIKATILTISQNCINFLTLAKTALPHETACTMLQKLSSKIIISDASFAISVPVIPIARPTSACFSYGASFEPSPVAATTLPRNYSL